MTVCAQTTVLKYTHTYFNLKLVDSPPQTFRHPRSSFCSTLWMPPRSTGLKFLYLLNFQKNSEMCWFSPTHTCEHTAAYTHSHTDATRTHHVCVCVSVQRQNSLALLCTCSGALALFLIHLKLLILQLVKPADKTTKRTTHRPSRRSIVSFLLLVLPLLLLLVMVVVVVFVLLLLLLSLFVSV